MQPTEKIHEDLGYVREVVGRAERAESPRSIWYLWALIGLVGFALIDIVPQRVGLYWTIAAPAGFLVSAWLGWRHGRARGQESVREGKTHLLHWGALLATVFLLYPLIGQGALRGETIAQVIVLIIAMGYFMAGVHLVPPLKWVGLLMAIGYVTVVYVDRFAWTALGVLIAVGLVVTARFTGEGRAGQKA